MKKRVGILLALLVLSLIILVYAQNIDSGKLILNDDANSTGSLVSSENFNVGDIFYLDDGRKAKVTGIKDIEDDSVDFDNLNFFANGVLVHNKLSRPLTELEKKVVEALKDAGGIQPAKRIETLEDLKKTFEAMPGPDGKKSAFIRDVFVLEPGAKKIFPLADYPIPAGHGDTAKPLFDDVLKVLGDNNQIRRPKLAGTVFIPGNQETCNIPTLALGGTSLDSQFHWTYSSRAQTYTDLLNYLEEISTAKVSSFKTLGAGGDFQSLLLFPNGDRLYVRMLNVL